MWAVTDPTNHASIMGKLLESYDGFVDVQVQNIEMLSRNPGMVNVGRVVLVKMFRFGPCLPTNKRRVVTFSRRD